MIKNIIFDLGNVLLDFNPKVYVQSKITEEKMESGLKGIILNNSKDLRIELKEFDVII
jgi:FMN phosphatase YigB (HAD superfamily)